MHRISERQVQAPVARPYRSGAQCTTCKRGAPATHEPSLNGGFTKCQSHATDLDGSGGLIIKGKLRRVRWRPIAGDALFGWGLSACRHGGRRSGSARRSDWRRMSRRRRWRSAGLRRESCHSRGRLGRRGRHRTTRRHAPPTMPVPVPTCCPHCGRRSGSALWEARP